MSITAKAPASRSYPYVGGLKSEARREAGDERIVLFTGPGKGIQIGGNIGTIGDAASNWREDCFDPLPRGTALYVA